MPQAPTIGRTVHIEVRESLPGRLELGPRRTRPGIITNVNEDGTVDLVVFGQPEHLVADRCGVRYSDAPKLDHWSWPPRA